MSAVAFAAPAVVAEKEQTAQLLDQLGVRALLEQTPAVLTAAIEAETHYLQSTPQPANWQRELETKLKPQLLLQEVTRFLHSRYRADTFLQAQQRLQEPLVKRVGYFDLAMTQSGAEKNLRDFLAHNGSGAMTDVHSSDARRTLVRDIDTATASSLLMATLQSAIAARVQQAAGKGTVAAAVLQDEISERQRYLAPLSIDYLLYDYRYLRDDELREYRDLMRDANIQQLLDGSRQAVLAAISGGPTPPPVPPQ